MGEARRKRKFLGQSADPRPGTATACEHFAAALAVRRWCNVLDVLVEIEWQLDDLPKRWLLTTQRRAPSAALLLPNQPLKSCYAEAQKALACLSHLALVVPCIKATRRAISGLRSECCDEKPASALAASAWSE